MMLIPCGVLMAFKSFSQKTGDDPVTLTQMLFASVAAFIIPVSCLLFAETIGFVRVSFLATFIMLQMTRRGKLVQNLVIALAATNLLSYIFREFLLVPLPDGTLF